MINASSIHQNRLRCYFYAILSNSRLLAVTRPAPIMLPIEQGDTLPNTMQKGCTRRYRYARHILETSWSIIQSLNRSTIHDCKPISKIESGTSDYTFDYTMEKRRTCNHSSFLYLSQKMSEAMGATYLFESHMLHLN